MARMARARVVLLRGLAAGLIATGVVFVAAADDLESRAAAAEQAGHLREAFQLYVAAYQSLPEPQPADADQRLREHIVKLAAKLEPPPEVPPDAMRFGVRAQVMLEEARDLDGFHAAATEMRRAIRLAPWHGPLAFNLALVEEKRGHYAAALANLRIYLSTSPADREQAQAKLYALEYKAEKLSERMKRYTAGETPKDNGEALALYQEACEAGIPKGCGDLGEMYEHGHGVPEDTARAIFYFDRGCQDADPNSCYRLGIYKERSDPSTAAAAYDIACRADYGSACYYLGLARERQDRAKALGYFRKACALGFKDACKKVGKLGG